MRLTGRVLFSILYSIGAGSPGLREKPGAGMDWMNQLGRNESEPVDPSEGSAFFVDSGGWGLEPRTGAGRRLYHQENLERCKGFFFVASLLET